MWDWLKKIGNFFHLSKLGSGHSESIEWAFTNSLHMPPDVKYEAAWWNRTVKLDGWFPYNHDLKEESLECAEAYAHKVSIGSLSQLRNFLEVSLKQTDRPQGYVDMFMAELLNVTGRDLLHRRFQELTGTRNYKLDSPKWKDVPKGALSLESITKLILGFTRKREFLNDAWAADELWVPPTPKIVLA